MKPVVVILLVISSYQGHLEGPFLPPILDQCKLSLCSGTGLVLLWYVGESPVCFMLCDSYQIIQRWRLKLILGSVVFGENTRCRIK